MEEVITIIQSVGFPIAACVFMARYIVKSVDSFRETIAENTKILNLIYERMKREDEYDE